MYKMNSVVTSIASVLLLLIFWKVPSIRLAIFIISLIGCIALVVLANFSLVEMTIPLTVCLGMMAFLLFQSFRLTRVEVEHVQTGARAPHNSPFHLSPFAIGESSIGEKIRAPPSSPMMSSSFSSLSPHTGLSPLHRVRFSPNALDRLQQQSSPRRLAEMTQFRRLELLPDWQEWKEEVERLSSSSSTSSSAPMKKHDPSEKIGMIHALKQAEASMERNDPQSVDQLLDLKERVEAKIHHDPRNRRFYVKLMGLVSTGIAIATTAFFLSSSFDSRRWDGRGNVVM